MLNKLINWRWIMVVIALSIVVFSLFFTNKIVKSIANDERKKVETVALALQTLTNTTNVNADLNLPTSIVANNTTVPLIVVNGKDEIITHNNLFTEDNKKIKQKLIEFKQLHPPIVVEINPQQYIFYGNSTILTQLKFFPYILFGILFIFLLIVFIAWNTANQSLQNRVWVGMSKETAHQLGTPLTSLFAWVEHLRQIGQTTLANDMQNDVDRLQLIADRFSKIGSKPQLNQENIIARLETVVEYMRKRCSQKISINLYTNHETDIPAMLNAPLFDWVTENLIRNALDAMQGIGAIHITIINQPAEIYIDFADTGKGIPAKEFKKVFKPGFTTKKRGWGLGLSLAKRIIREYHHGNIYVLKSELNKGTTFRIKLNR